MPQGSLHILSDADVKGRSRRGRFRRARTSLAVCGIALAAIGPPLIHAQNATAPVPAGQNPHAVAVNPVTNKIYVADKGDGTVTVIDGGTNTTTTVAAESNPYAVAV